MMKLNDVKNWQKKLDSMRLKDLYHLCEMSKLTQSIGGGEEVIPPLNPILANVKPGSYRAINFGRSKERETLGEMIWKHLQLTSRSIHGEDACYPWIHTKHEGYRDSIVIWDHWQIELKECVYIHRKKDPPIVIFDWELWDESSNEEV